MWCRVANEPIMLSVVMLNVVMLSVVAPTPHLIGRHSLKCVDQLSVGQLVFDEIRWNRMFDKGGKTDRLGLVTFPLGGKV